MKLKYIVLAMLAVYLFALPLYAQGNGTGGITVLVVSTPMPTPPPLGSCPRDSARATGLVSDHQGITIGTPTGTRGTSSYNVPYTQPVTCSTIAGSNVYKIYGYMPTQADVGKHISIGMPLGINGSTSTVGAGYSGFPGAPLRVQIASVNKTTNPPEITGQTYTSGGGGSPSANATNAVTNAECDVGTPNSAALQADVDALSTGGTLCVPPGNYMIDNAIVMDNNQTIYCQPGAIFYDPRNDRYNQGNGKAINSYIASEGFSWTSQTGGGADGCSYVQTAVYGISADSGYEPSEPNWNIPWASLGSHNLTFHNLTDINIWNDDDIALMAASGDISFSDHNTVEYNYTQNGWAAGPSIISGAHNLFQYNVCRNICFDVEPNNHVEAAHSGYNTFDHNICVYDSTVSHKGAGVSFGAVGHFVGACGTAKECADTNIITNNQVLDTGDPATPFGIYGGCAISKSYQIGNVEAPYACAWTNPPACNVCQYSGYPFSCCTGLGTGCPIVDSPFSRHGGTWSGNTFSASIPCHCGTCVN